MHRKNIVYIGIVTMCWFQAFIGESWNISHAEKGVLFQFSSLPLFVLLLSNVLYLYILQTPQCSVIIIAIYKVRSLKKGQKYIYSVFDETYLSLLIVFQWSRVNNSMSLSYSTVIIFPSLLWAVFVKYVICLYAIVPVFQFCRYYLQYYFKSIKKRNM